MKIKYLKLKNWILVSLMGVLGLAGCHCSKNATATTPADDPETEKGIVAPPDEPIRLMYGVPTMQFHVRGQVQDAKGRPVKDIRVNLLERNMDIEGTTLQGDPGAIEKWLQGTEVRTDKEGRFEILNSGLPQEEVRLLIRDADGKANGDFHDQLLQMKVESSDMDRTDAAGWNQGTFKKEVKVKLEKK